MRRRYRGAFKYVIFFALSLTVLIGSTATFAWLATTWTSGNFVLRGANMDMPSVELWTYHNEGDDDDGWYITYENSDKNLIEKAVDSIGTFEERSGRSTFTPEGDFSLYLGTITNLAQESDNLPVYVKFTVELSPKSKNTIDVEYSVDDDYIKAYQVGAGRVGTLVSGVGEDGKTLSEALSDIEEFPFLNVSCVVVDKEDEYEIRDKLKELPEGFDALFSGDDAMVYDYDAKEFASKSGNDAFEITNTSETNELVKYVYMKFSVNPKTLQDALLKTELKKDMPAYLIFSTNLALEIRATSSQTIS